MVAQLRGAGVSGRPASRQTYPPLDWSVERVYLLPPDFTDPPEAFLLRAVDAGYAASWSGRIGVST